MPRKPKTPQAALAQVDAYEARANGQKSDDSNTTDARTRPRGHAGTGNLTIAAREADAALRRQLWRDRAQAWRERLGIEKASLAERYEFMAERALARAEEIIDDAETPGEAMRCSQIAHDRMRLEREQATAIVDNMGNTREEKLQTLKTLAEKKGLRLVVNE